MSKKHFLSKDVLEELYIEKEMTMKEISLELNCAVGSVYNYMHKYNIPSRKTADIMKGFKHSKESLDKISKANKGRKISEHTKKLLSKSKTGKFIKKTKYGGHSKVRNDGYIAIYTPDHPDSNSEGYVMEHHLIMEEHIGRRIKKNEVVHHINRIRDDNDIKNLQLMTFKEHCSFHMKERHEERRRLLSTK